MSDEKPAIDVASDGPYLVHGVETLVGSKGPIETKANYALCRCGGSANKPFCDGTHKKIGFKGTNESDPAKRKTREYVGKDITVLDRRWICAHSGECVRGLPEVWRVDARPWIQPDNADASKVAEVALHCPSGALTVAVHGVETQVPSPPRTPAVTICKNGPYQVTGGPELRNPDGLEPPVLERYSLCRCGASKNKPFCDDSHTTIGFVDDAT